MILINGLKCTEEGDNMCLDDDDLYDYECMDKFKENASCLVLTLTFMIATTALIIAGLNLRTNHHQDTELKNDLADAIKSEVVIRTEVSEIYYGISLNPETNRNTIDHIPGSLLMPKVGALYEKSHCIIKKNSPLAVMYIMTQFESDFRGARTASRLSTHYHTIQMAFEVPFGDVLDGKTGSGYLGYNEGYSSLGDTIPPLGSYDSPDHAMQGTSTTRMRCAVPYCPNYDTMLSVGETNNLSPFAKLHDEHYVINGGLYERIAVVGNESNAVYMEERVPGRIACGCTKEIPPRFQCSFPAAALNNKHGWFRLDISFEYVLKPTTKNINHP
jgi:hypothetical protein